MAIEEALKERKSYLGRNHASFLYRRSDFRDPLRAASGITPSGSRRAKPRVAGGENPRNPSSRSSVGIGGPPCIVSLGEGLGFVRLRQHQSPRVAGAAQLAPRRFCRRDVVLLPEACPERLSAPVAGRDLGVGVH